MGKKVTVILVLIFLIILIVVLTSAVLLFSLKKDTIKSNSEEVRLSNQNSALRSYKLDSTSRIDMKIQVRITTTESATNSINSSTYYNGYIDREGKQLIMHKQGSGVEVENEYGRANVQEDNESGWILVKDGKITESGSSFDSTSSPEYDNCIMQCSRSYDPCDDACQDNYDTCSYSTYEGSFSRHMDACYTQLENCLASCSADDCLNACEQKRVVDFERILNDIDSLNKIIMLAENKTGEVKREGGLKTVKIYPSILDLQRVSSSENYQGVSNESVKEFYIKIWLDNNIIVKDELFLSAQNPQIEMTINLTEQRSEINNVQESVFELPSA